MKKKLVSVLMATVMVLSLAACGGGSSDSDSGSSDAGSDSDAAIVIWQPTDRESIENWWVEKIDEWNADHPDMTAERIAIDRSDSYAYENKITTAVTSNSLPDILFVDGPQVSYYAANGIIVPIDEYFPEEELSDFMPSTV